MALMVYKNRPVEVIETTGSLSKINDNGNEYSVKTEALKNPKTPRRPKSLNIATITEAMKPFVAYLATPEAKTKLTLESQCEETDFSVRKQYTALTGGDELVAGEGYNIAPHSAGKEGCEGAVTFVMPDAALVPAEITAMMVQRPGFINRIGFVWALVEAGFKVTR